MADYSKGRNDGLALALKIAKEGGIETAIKFMREWKEVWLSEQAKMYFDTAIQALQEKLDRKKMQSECEYCHGDLSKRKLFNCCDRHLIFVMEDVQKPPKGESFLFCPMCGRKLTNDSVCRNKNTEHIGGFTDIVEGGTME